MAGRPRLLPLLKEATLSVLSLAFPPGLASGERLVSTGVAGRVFNSRSLRTKPLWFSHTKDRLCHLDPLAPSFCEAGAGQPFDDSSFQFSVFSYEQKELKTENCKLKTALQRASKFAAQLKASACQS